MLALLPVLALLLALLLGCSSGFPDTAGSGTTAGNDRVRATQAFAPTSTLVPPPTATPTVPPPSATPVPKLCGERMIGEPGGPTISPIDLYAPRELQILDLAPGYGGLFLLETPSPELDSILYVFMLDTSQGQAAKDAVEQVYGEEITKERKFKVLRGKYDIEQLYRWEACIKKEAFKNNDSRIIKIRLKSTHNSLFIMSDEPDDLRKYLREKLPEIGVPPDAVMVRVLMICLLLNIDCQCPPLRSLPLHDRCARFQSIHQ